MGIVSRIRFKSLIKDSNVWPMKMSCSLINWFWMFLLSYYVWNCLPINFLSIYLPYHIRYNESRNVPNTEYPVRQTPSLSLWMNATAFVHLRNSIGARHPNKCARCWAETEPNPFITFIIRRKLVQVTDAIVTENKLTLSYANFPLLFVAARPLIFNGKLFMCCAWM